MRGGRRSGTGFGGRGESLLLALTSCIAATTSSLTAWGGSHSLATTSSLTAWRGFGSPEKPPVCAIGKFHELTDQETVGFLRLPAKEWLLEQLEKTSRDTSSKAKRIANGTASQVVCDNDHFTRDVAVQSSASLRRAEREINEMAVTLLLRQVLENRDEQAQPWGKRMLDSLGNRFKKSDDSDGRCSHQFDMYVSGYQLPPRRRTTACQALTKYNAQAEAAQRGRPPSPLSKSPLSRGHSLRGSRHH